MPLNEKGQEILEAMQEEYGEEKGKEVFYASKNKGTISGVDEAPRFNSAAGETPGRPISVTGTTLADMNNRNRKLRE